MPSANNTISVIIPSSRPDKVVSTIRGLILQTLLVDVLEIIVVTPRFLAQSDEVEKIPKVRFLLVDELYPPGKMRNIGAGSASGNYFAFIDDDCIPETRWLEKLRNEISLYHDVGIVGCRVVSGNAGFWAKSADYSLFAAYQYPNKLFIELGSAAIVVRRQAFVEAGGFDEILLGSEDWEFSLRLQEVGWQCMFTPAAKVFHFHGRESFFAIARSAFLSGFRSGLFVQERHYVRMSWLAKISVHLGTPLLYWLLILPYAVVLAMVQGIGLARSNWKMCIHLPVIFVCHVLYHLGVWRRLRQDAD